MRKPDQAEAVKRYSAEPLCFNIHDEADVHDNVLKNKINVVFSLTDANSSTSQELFIKALADLKKPNRTKCAFSPCE
jgi:hypothetical protein